MSNAAISWQWRHTTTVTTTDLLSRVGLPQVWQALGGPPIRHRRGVAWWRGGDGLTVSLDVGSGRWYDHRDGVGGGLIELVARVQGRDKATAFRWLADLAGIPLGESSPAERAAYAERRRAVEAEAAELVVWRDERLREISGMRATHWRAHHRAQRVIDREGISTECGGLAADVIEATERTIARLDAEYDRIARASWDALVPEFRRERSTWGRSA